MVAAVKLTLCPQRPVCTGQEGPTSEPWGLPRGQQVRLVGIPSLLKHMSLPGGEPYPAICKPQKARQTVPLRNQAWICHGHLENTTLFPNLLRLPSGLWDRCPRLMGNRPVSGGEAFPTGLADRDQSTPGMSHLMARGTAEREILLGFCST